MKPRQAENLKRKIRDLTLALIWESETNTRLRLARGFEPERVPELEIDLKQSMEQTKVRRSDIRDLIDSLTEKA